MRLPEVHFRFSGQILQETAIRIPREFLQGFPACRAVLKAYEYGYYKGYWGEWNLRYLHHECSALRVASQRRCARPPFVVQFERCSHAGVSELADEPDSKSGALHWACGFKSHLRHHFRISNLAKFPQFLGQNRTTRHRMGHGLSRIAATSRTAKLGIPRIFTRENLTRGKRTGNDLTVRRIAGW
jgi:hypothetical protein